MDEVKVPKPIAPVSDYQKEQIAIEYAFDVLISTSMMNGLPIQKPLGLMYLPTQELTRNFQVACREILASLRVPK